MLQVRSLSKTYRNGVEALKGVSFDAEPGIYGLLGPNGAGKSSLMKILATLLLPTSGTASLRSAEQASETLDLIARPGEARSTIGYLPQDSGAFARVSAAEALEYLAALRGIGPARHRKELVRRELARVNLLDVAHRRVDTFSGGMRQRFGIATVFLHNPRLVIVDEPTAGLDPQERRRFQCLLAEAARDCVLLLSSHIVEDIEGLCTRMALLRGGELILEGVPAELVGSLRGRVWSRFVTDTELDELTQRVRLLAKRPARGGFEIRALGEELGELGFTEVDPDLEDLYNMHVPTHEYAGTPAAAASL